MKLILDYAKWRSGGWEGTTVPKFLENIVGKGPTCLNNDQGFQCCLGQFSLQLNPSLTEKDLIGTVSPKELGVIVKDLSQNPDDGFGYSDTELSNKAMAINDNEKTTPQEKIVLLKALFSEHGHEIEVINEPCQSSSQAS